MSIANDTANDTGIVEVPPSASGCPTCSRSIPASVRERALRGRIQVCSVCSTKIKFTQAPAPIPSASIPEPLREANEKSNKAVQSGATALGAVIWHDFVGVSLPADDLADLAVQVGIPEEYVAGIRAHGALGRACRSIKVPGIYPLRAESTDERLIYAFTRREGDVTTLTRDDVQRATYDRATRTLSLATPWNEQVIRDAFARCLVNVESDKITETIRRYLDASGAVRLRSLGIVYFVPAHALDAVRRVKAFMAKLRALGHASASVGDVLLADAPETRETVRRGAEEHISSDLDVIEEILTEALDARGKGERVVRISTFLKIKKQAELLEEKGLSYAELAELNAGTIRKRVAEIRERVAEVAEVTELET